MYESETGFYLTGTRYYDPEIGRFINADTTEVLTVFPLSLTDKNLFAYCDNNPIMRVDYTGAFWETAFDIATFGISVNDVIRDPDDWLNWVGLAGDLIDIVPFVCGVGEVVKAGKVYKKADAVYDTVDDVVDVSTDIKVGWKTGDNINNLTKAGTEPKWNTLKQRFWKNEALNNPSKYSDADLHRMKRGLAPIGDDGFSIELHHPKGRSGTNFYHFYPLTKTEHIKIHSK